MMDEEIKDEEKLIRSDFVVDNYKLREYLELCINDLSEEYIRCLLKYEHTSEFSDMVLRHRTMLLCIKEICKNRKKF